LRRIRLLLRILGHRAMRAQENQRKPHQIRASQRTPRCV
jgi:hypothetical protein